MRKDEFFQKWFSELGNPKKTIRQEFLDDIADLWLEAYDDAYRECQDFHYEERP